jgi:hypothetical protein
VGLCPFHHEKTPSFKLRDDLVFFHCFVCIACGDVIEFVRRREQLDFRRSVVKVAGAPLPVGYPTTSALGRAWTSTHTLLENESARLLSGFATAPAICLEHWGRNISGLVLSICPHLRYCASAHAAGIAKPAESYQQYWLASTAWMGLLPPFIASGSAVTAERPNCASRNARRAQRAAAPCA